MKRLITFIICALFVLTACGAPDFSTENHLLDYDADMSGVVRADGGYYYVSEAPRNDMYIKSYICYYELETGNSGIVCGRPECLHQDENCNAYFPAGADGLSWYAGKLYWYDPYGEGIYCCDPDLRNRQKAVEAESFGLASQSTAFHRGYFYIWGRTQDVHDAEVSNIWRFERISLETGECETLFESFLPSLGALGITGVSFSGPHAYIAFDRSDMTFNDEILQPAYDFDIIKFDLLSGDSEVISKGSDFQPFGIYAEGSEVWVPFNRYSESGTTAGVAKLSDGSFEETFSYPVSGALELYEAPTLSGGVALTCDIGGDGLTLCVRNLSGGVIFEGAPNVVMNYTDNTFVESLSCDREYVYVKISELGVNFSSKTIALPLDGSEGFVIGG